MTTEERIKRLEEEAARYRARYRRLLGVAGFVGFIIIACAVVALSFRPTPVEAQAGPRLVVGEAPLQEVRTPQLVIVDKDGRERAILTALTEAPGLWLLDEKGKARATLVAPEKGAMLLLNDENASPRAMLATKEGAMLGLFDEKGTKRATLAALEKGPELVLYDEKGTGRAGLTANKDVGPVLVVFDEKGRSVWKAP